MDRVWPAPWDVRDQDPEGSTGVTLPSRAAAVEALLPGLRSQAGPLLITGDAGVGKTWLLRRLEAEGPADWRWLRVDLSPAVGVAGLYRLIGHGLGLDAAGGPGSSRVNIADWLSERAADGTSWVLALDEAHGAGEDVLEEVRVLSNQVGRAGGFAGMVLVGQTVLARRLGARALLPLASRIAARVHLRPLDIEEARSLVEGITPGSARDRERFEIRHRDTGGNPRRLVHVSRLQGPVAARVAREARVAAPPPRVPVSVVAPAPESTPARRWESPVLGEVKPPIREEEGLIEVGWEPEAAPEVGEEAGAAPAAVREESALESEETVSDHYAALQAWNEWANNQGRLATAAKPDVPETLAPADADLDEEAEAGSLAGSPDVWAEGQQEFAPYSQLFSRIKQRRDSN